MTRSAGLSATEISFDGTAYAAAYLPGPERWPQIAFVRGVPSLVDVITL